MKVEIKRVDRSLPLPVYETAGSVGFDILCREDTTIEPKSIGRVPGNVIVKVPEGYALVVALRSSTPAKKRLLCPLHGDGDPPEPLRFNFNASLFHRHGRLMCIAYEGRQGYLGRSSFLPFPTEWEVIDDYLSAITVFLELGIEGFYAKANRDVFK